MDVRLVISSASVPLDCRMMVCFQIACNEELRNQSAQAILYPGSGAVEECGLGLVKSKRECHVSVCPTVFDTT